VINFSENRYRSRNAHEIERCIFHYNDNDDLLIKFKPTGEFNLKRVNDNWVVLYVNSIYTQRWYGINVQEFCIHDVAIFSKSYW
jgi:hypothetical protein